MMRQEELALIKVVYERFLDSESTDWSDLDYNLEFFGWLNDKELVNETKIKRTKHLKGKVFMCATVHDQQDCFAPYILEAVGYILNEWDKTRTLSEKNRYILLYYTAMSEMGVIFEA